MHYLVIFKHAFYFRLHCKNIYTVNFSIIFIKKYIVKTIFKTKRKSFAFLTEKKNKIKKNIHYQKNNKLLKIKTKQKMDQFFKINPQFYSLKQPNPTKSN